MKLIRKAVRKAKDFFSALKSRFDKQGAYTGTADDKNGNDAPEQDADDL
ncbi:MAG: hypothetical protein J6Y74_03220 [Clostridia bacterium]|nr:hypothetical protein [Clostridia bacterium]